LAVDLGQLGPTYQIREEDFIEQMKALAKKKIASGEWDGYERDLKEKTVQAFTDPMPLSSITTAQYARTWLFDPAIVTNRDIVDQNGQVLYPAGTRVSPLEVVSLPEPLLFIDGRDPRQVRTAEALIKKHHGQVKLILIAGNLQKLGKQLKQPVYFDQGGARTAQLGIHAVPAIVTQEDKKLRVKEFTPS
jgi:conjugal transfer pilus assembly protein TraW